VVTHHESLSRPLFLNAGFLHKPVNSVFRQRESKAGRGANLLDMATRLQNSPKLAIRSANRRLAAKRKRIFARLPSSSYQSSEYLQRSRTSRQLKSPALDQKYETTSNKANLTGTPRRSSIFTVVKALPPIIHRCATSRQPVYLFNNKSAARIKSRAGCVNALLLGRKMVASVILKTCLQPVARFIGRAILSLAAGGIPALGMV